MLISADGGLGLLSVSQAAVVAVLRVEITRKDVTSHDYRGRNQIGCQSDR